MFKLRLYDLFPSKYANVLLGSNVTYIHYTCFTLCQYTWYIPFVTSLKQRHGFASNSVWMFLGWTPTKLVKIGVLPLFKIEFLVILCIFLPSLRFKVFVKNWSVTTTLPLGTIIFYKFMRFARSFVEIWSINRYL